MTPFTNCRIVGTNVNPDEYHKHGLEHPRGSVKRPMSEGETMKFLSCPDRYMAGEEEDATDPQVWGSMFDCLTLTPDQFKSRFAFHPAKYTDSKGEEKEWAWQSKTCRQWREDAEARGLTIVKEDGSNQAGKGGYKQAVKAVARLWKDPIIAQALDGDHQVMVTGEYHDRATGIVIPVKSLIDFVPKQGGKFGRCLGDLKTCQNANPDLWWREVLKWRYHVQAAWYTDIYNEATKQEREDWLHILSENKPPYQPGRCLLSIEYVGIGRTIYAKALGYYCECIAQNKWPGYNDGPNSLGGWSLIECPEWVKNAIIVPSLSTPNPEEDEEESELPS